MAEKSTSESSNVPGGIIGSSTRAGYRSAPGIAMLLLLFLLGCGGKQLSLDPKTKSDQELFEIGQTYVKNKDYDEAREAFRTVFDNFPKSDYRILAKLAFAETYYQQGTASNYIIAIQEYQDFISLFPFSPKACYAQLQAGKCYFNMAEKPDRDQTNTRRALDEFRKVIDNYPDCEYYQEAYEALLTSYGKLAEHEYIVGRYYQRTGRHTAAVDRFKGILKDYPEKVYLPKHIFGLAESLRELEQFAESCTFYDMLLKNWPNSEFTAKATQNRAKVCTAADMEPSS